MASEVVQGGGGAHDAHAMQPAGAFARHPLQWLRQSLPEGRELPEEQWRVRHRGILVLIAAHAVLLPAFGLLRGVHPLLALSEGALIASIGALAWMPRLGRRFRSSTAALALVTSSAVLVQFWGGYIEGHFHFFVVVAVVSLYQDWVPFLLAILYTAVDHGAIGTVAPDWVYGTNAAAVAHPWLWALIHAGFVLAECVALLAAWKASESARAHAEIVLASAGDAMLGVGPDGRVAFANPAAAELVGRPPKQLVGLEADRLVDGLSAGANGRAGLPVERDLVRPDGAVVPVEVVQTPMRGARRGSVVALKDLTARRQAEADRLQGVAREHELARLKEQDAFKTLFINTAAHELRTPMTPIKIHIHVLESGKRGELNAEQRKTVEILKRNLDRLGLLIEDVLNVSRLQAGHLSLERRRISLDAVVRDVAQTFQPMAERAGVRLQLHAAEGTQVDADPKRVSQVLFNLIDNALKFTPAGGRVEVALRADRGWAEVQVRDSGAGIRAEDIPKLFQPFSQVHDTMQQTKGGSGLGLYISSGILELHGGSIRCESPGLGLGTTFTVLLPLATGPPPQPQPVAEPSAARAAAA
jgi:PAS domain S-box-containing protein